MAAPHVSSCSQTASRLLRSLRSSSDPDHSAGVRRRRGPRERRRTPGADRRQAGRQFFDTAVGRCPEVSTDAFPIGARENFPMIRRRSAKMNLPRTAMADSLSRDQHQGQAHGAARRESPGVGEGQHDRGLEPSVFEFRVEAVRERANLAPRMNSIEAIGKAISQSAARLTRARRLSPRRAPSAR